MRRVRQKIIREQAKAYALTVMPKGDQAHERALVIRSLARRMRRDYTRRRGGFFRV